MRNYKGYEFKVVRISGYDFYHLFNEKKELEAEFISLRELKEAVDARLELGYWAY